MVIWASLKPKDLVSAVLRIGRQWLGAGAASPRPPRFGGPTKTPADPARR